MNLGLEEKLLKNSDGNIQTQRTLLKLLCIILLKNSFLIDWKCNIEDRALCEKSSRLSAINSYCLYCLQSSWIVAALDLSLYANLLLFCANPVSSLERLLLASVSVNLSFSSFGNSIVKQHFL